MNKEEQKEMEMIVEEAKRKALGEWKYNADKYFKEQERKRRKEKVISSILWNSILVVLIILTVFMGRCAVQKYCDLIVVMEKARRRHCR